MIPWDQKGIIGARRFLEKVYSLVQNFQIPNPKPQTNPKSKIPNSKLDALLAKTIKKVGDDIEAMKFNTAISSLMILVNSFYEKSQEISREQLKNLLIILSPFAPHLAEELWQTLKFKGLCSQQSWPKVNEKLIKEERVLLIVQINGKVRDKIEINAGLDQNQAEGIVLQSEKIKALIGQNEVKKIIFVPNKLINIVI